MSEFCPEEPENMSLFVQLAGSAEVRNFTGRRLARFGRDFCFAGVLLSLLKFALFVLKGLLSPFILTESEKILHFLFSKNFSVALHLGERLSIFCAKGHQNRVRETGGRWWPAARQNGR